MKLKNGRETWLADLPIKKGAGQADTPVLSDIQAFDFELQRPSRSEPVLHHFTGCPCLPNGFEPLEPTDGFRRRGA